MPDYSLQMIEEVYALIRLLPRLNHRTLRKQLPANGIYVFFERGEVVQWRSRVIDRIVRVGTHRGDGRFRTRIRQHYGKVRSLGGNKNSSVFRKHVGGALLRKANPHDPRLEEWLAQGGPSFNEVEELVSRALREGFTFSCFRVDSPGERLALERGLIALFASYPLGQPSADWLGLYAADERLRRSGLWNTQGTGAEPLTLAEFSRLEDLVKETLAEARV